MCEWLSRDEWCDVRLLCGGRAFAAHRAVLASVSSFLRRLLLSCPIDDSPTLIVLPDFDLDAMSAVLYYIYNGEVTMPKQKLEMFLDIIKAMQIFIDRQYLTQLSVNFGENDCNLFKSTSNDCIFILRTENDDKQLVTFKKLVQPNSQYSSRDELDYLDFTQAPSLNWNEHFKPSLGNLQSSHGDRQRDYFLRDSVMETYPRNRNANGRVAGVPAIPNGFYRAPTSLLLTNANANGHLSSDDAILPSNEKSLDETRHKSCDLESAIHIPNPHIRKENSIIIGLRRKLTSTHLNDIWTSHQRVPTVSSVEVLQQSAERKLSSHLDLSIIQKASVSPVSWSPIFIDGNINDKIAWNSEFINSVGIKTRITTNISRKKVAILNKALDNPWCPRLPNSFRPFKRKDYSPRNINSDTNDSNNNIQAKPAFIIKDECLLESIKLQNNVNFPASIIGDDKEHVNHQVLLAAEAVSSRTSRFECNECCKTFSQLRNYKYHMSVHRGTKEFAASCTVCGKCFNDRGYLSSHMKIHRNRKEYKCTQCPKSFNQRVAYNMHVRIHTGVKPHVCPQCGKAFSRKMLLKQHQRTHSGERPYACPHCDKRFADRSNMTLHLRLHSGIKPFKCPMCPKSFTKKHHLKSHVNFHTGAKPYSCPRCQLAFTQSSNMRTHLKRCTAPEPATDDQRTQTHS